MLISDYLTSLIKESVMLLFEDIYARFNYLIEYPYIKISSFYL